MGRNLDIITAEAKSIEAVLKVMLKLAFAKMAQVQIYLLYILFIYP